MYVGRVSFQSNKISKVILPASLSSDTAEGLGEQAFTDNKISEIVAQGDFAKIKVNIDQQNLNNLGSAPFSNQAL